VAEIPNVHLCLSSKAENVLLVRQALSGLAERIGLDPIELNDVSTAVSEACNNVVLHAYGQEQGPLDVEIDVAPPNLEVVVRDQGVGIGMRELGHEAMESGIGLPVIRALTRTVEFNSLEPRGTEVRMRFEVSATRPLEPAREDHGERQSRSISGSATEAGDTLAFTVGPPSLARAVLPRVLGALAARAYFSTDRISDTQLLADAIAAQTPSALDAAHLNVEVALKPRTLELRIGPLRPGLAEAVLQNSPAEPLGSVLERLSDGYEISQDGGAETLALRLADER
jgi:serine/threonine-protein kinase RsbW